MTTDVQATIDFANLLCSRLCHDLLSPVGALNNILTRLTSSKTYNVAREAGRHMLGFAPPLLELARRAEEHVKGMIAPGTLFEEIVEGDLVAGACAFAMSSECSSRKVERSSTGKTTAAVVRTRPVRQSSQRRTQRPRARSFLSGRSSAPL